MISNKIAFSVVSADCLWAIIQRERETWQVYDISALYRNHSLYVKKLIHKTTARYRDILSEDDLDDINQAVWEKACVYFQRFRGDCAESTYLFYIVTSCINDHVSSNLKNDCDEIDSVPEDNRPGEKRDSLHDREILDALHEEAERLRPKQKIIFRLILNGHTQSQIAGKMKLAQSTVSEHWENARHRLEKALRERFSLDEREIEELIWGKMK